MVQEEVMEEGGDSHRARPRARARARARARVREVSSRFMSPSPSPSPTPPGQRHREDENQPPPPASHTPSTLHRNQRPPPPTSKSCSGRIANAFASHASSSAAAKLLQATALSADYSFNPNSLSLSRASSLHSTTHSLPPTPFSPSKHVKSLANHFTHPPKPLSLPPVPPPPATATDTRKPKKASTHHQHLHTFRLLYNRYLQWRYANAKAHSSIQAHHTHTQKALYSLALKMSELRDSVNVKRIQVQLLQRARTLSTILEVQIPYLDEWSTFEEDYSASLAEVTGALLNASAQLPIGGNVKVDAMEVGDAINSSLKMMESIVFDVQRFMPKVEETDIAISELARVVGGERAFIGECGSLLARAHKSQVEECSLRSQLMQLHSISHKSNEAN